MYKVRFGGMLLLKLVAQVNISCWDDHKEEDIDTKEKCGVDIPGCISFAKLSQQHIYPKEDKVTSTKEVKERNLYMFSKTDHFKWFDPPHTDQGSQCVLKN